MSRKNSILVGLSILSIIYLLISFGALPTLKSDSNIVNVLYAGSLISVMETSLGPSFSDLEHEFNGEGHGAVQNANMVLDGQRFPDVFISAGIIPIKMLFENDPPLASWFLPFASDEMVIAYNPDSDFVDEFERARQGIIPWYNVLSIPEVKFIRTDPELNPKGYYMIITAKLADIFYNNASISQNILRGERNPLQIQPEETLITLLETGEIDAVEAYRHEAVEKGLPFIILPQQINLGDTDYTEYYKQVNYTLNSGRTIYGEPIVFALTIPSTVKNIDGAINFIEFILSSEAQSILQQNGFGKISFTLSGDISDIPEEIIQIIQKKGFVESK